MTDVMVLKYYFTVFHVDIILLIGNVTVHSTYSVRLYVNKNATMLGVTDGLCGGKYRTWERSVTVQG